MQNRRFKHSLIASLCVHTLLWIMAAVLPGLWKKPPRDIIEVTIESPKPQPPPPPTKPQPKVAKQQIVDQDLVSVNDEEPDEDHFLSAQNQKVEKQTVAEKLGDFKNKKDPKAHETPDLMEAPPKEQKPKMDFTKFLDKKSKAQPEKLADESDVTLKKDQNENSTDKESGGSKGEVSQTTDYLKDVDKDTETLLSTKQFAYYSFYSQIRKQLTKHWQGKVRQKISKILREGRSLATTDDKVTRMVITLNRKGALVKVQVLSDSGIRDLDEAAIEAFQEAAPFPSPPDGIVEPDGTIKIRWDFILES